MVRTKITLDLNLHFEKAKILQKYNLPKSINKLIEPYLDTSNIKINRSTVYKFNSLISEKWRQHNTFTIGDATHQTSPFIGQGVEYGYTKYS